MARAGAPIAPYGSLFQWVGGLRDMIVSTTTPSRIAPTAVPTFFGLLFIVSFIAAFCGVPDAAAGERFRHGIAMHGEPALPEGFAVFPYLNGEAPRGGRLTIGAQGTFDGLNPYVVKGVSAAQGITTLTVESLMKRSLDEPFTLYGLIAESIETPDDRSWVTFRLDPRARFSDGQPITAADVVFSFELLKTKGRPNTRASYGKVSSVETPDARTIRFDIAASGDRELPLILGLMPILPRHATDPDTFDQTGFAPLTGSGPYKITSVKPGQSVTYTRNAGYWGADLPVMRGSANFDEIRYDYYRDANSLFEAFKAGLVDIRFEGDATRWTSGYDIPAVADGRIVREAIPTRLPKGMSGFVYNTRRAVFARARVREALGYLFDFEWVNRNLFGGVYTRTASYFDGSVLSASGRPADATERSLLAPFPGAVRDDVMAGRWRPPVSDGSGRDRDMAKRALALLDEAGYALVDRRMRKRDSGELLAFEILVVSREHERLALNFADGLARIGVVASIRLVDSVQNERRRQRFDFDMLIASFNVSPSPGNEQAFRWGSDQADREGSFNFAGVRSPAVDAMIEAMLTATGREDFTSAVRALDRVLLSGFYVMPLFHLNDLWIARWSTVARPEILPLLGAAPETWWRQSR